MKLNILICYSIFLICCSACFSQTEISQTKKIEAQTITYRNQKFDVVIVDLRKTKVDFFWKNKNGEFIRSLGNLKKMVEEDDKNLLFAMNAGMYQRDRNPQGLFIEDGKIIKSLDTLVSGYGNFYLQPNGVFFMENDSAGILPSAIFSQKKINPTWATQSGPMLLVNGKVHPVFREGSDNLNIRNGVGMISQYEIAFVISQKEVNLFDFAMLFKVKLNCNNALYLDGFVSRAFIPQINRKDKDGNFGVMIGIVTEN